MANSSMSQYQPVGAPVMGSFNAGHRTDRRASQALVTQQEVVPQAPLSKRDKKRLALQEKMTEISINFTQNRDKIYRCRLQTLQADIAYINKAPVYDNKRLAGTFDDIRDVGDISAAASVSGSLHGASIKKPNGLDNSDETQLGPHALRFVQEIGMARDRMDADLNALKRTFDFDVENLRKDYIFAVSVAERERHRLLEACRQRLITQTEARRATLLRDKERLDGADSNALLHHSTQFGTGGAASPGGLLSNRKTRHTRHRMESDNIDAITTGSQSHRRRRKGTMDEMGSPVRETETGINSRIVDTVAPFTCNAEEEGVSVAEYMVEKIFTEKELLAHRQAAMYDVLEYQQFLKRRKIDTKSSKADGLTNIQKQDDSNIADPPLSVPDTSTTAEEAVAIFPTIGPASHVAPIAMERSNTNQSVHMTRSSRGVPNNPTTGVPAESLGELAGRERGVEMIGSFRGDKRKEEDYNRAAALTEREVYDDFALMAQAIRCEDAQIAGESIRKEDRIDLKSLLADVAGVRDTWLQEPEIDTHVFHLDKLQREKRVD